MIEDFDKARAAFEALPEELKANTSAMRSHKGEWSLMLGLIGGKEWVKSLPGAALRRTYSGAEWVAQWMGVEVNAYTRVRVETTLIEEMQ